MVKSVYQRLIKPEEPSIKKRDVKLENKKPLKWISEGLIVRVISDKIYKGVLYNQKIHIKNIINHSQFLATSKDNKTYDDLVEKDLETVLP